MYKKNRNKKKIKAFFFDRDNTLIKDNGYTFKKKQLKFLSGTIKAIQFLKKARILVVVITNQSGIARKYFKLTDVINFHKYLNKKLSLYKCKIDDFFICGCHPKFSKNKCKCRKPSPKMINQALKKWKLKKDEVIMIGDKKTDKIASKKAGVFFFYKKKISLYKQVKLILKRNDLPLL